MKQRKRGRKPVLRDKVVQTLSQVKVATAHDLNVSAAFLDTLVRNGFVRRVSSVKVTPGRGRPRRTFSLTPKGRGRARTLAHQAA